VRGRGQSSSDGSLLDTLVGVAAIALGLTAVGAVLEWHHHTCRACGYRWRHTGAFNVGNEKAHTCACCGTVQWFKDMPAGMLIAGHHH